VAGWVDLPFPTVTKLGSKWTAEILAIDSFGNLITNLKTDELAEVQTSSKVWIDVGEKQPPIRGLVSAYSDVEKGKLLAIGGSSGFVELSVREGNASKQIGIHQGDKVIFTFKT